MTDFDLAYCLAIGVLIVCALWGIEIWARDITDHDNKEN